MKRVLLLGGLDPSGGAGITLDATVVALHGLRPLPVAVVATVQNGGGFRSFAPVPDWQRALAAVLDDGPVHAVKLGMLGDGALALAVATALQASVGAVPIVVDPVLSATAGGFAPHAPLVAAYRERLVSIASLLTPNAPELATLFGGDVHAALAAGAAAVLHKGGHRDGPFADDELWTAHGHHTFRRPRLPVGPVRGTGCALAAAIAARLAGGSELVRACEAAGDWLAGRLRTLALQRPAADGAPRTLPFGSLDA